MKALKVWGLLMLTASAGLYGFGWLSGTYTGHGIASMDNAALMLTVLAIVCALISVTSLLFVYALHKKP